MLVWPIINIIFVTLVGYDSDVTKAIRKLQQKHWHKETISSAQLSLGQASLGDKRMTRDDLERHIPDTVNEGSNIPTEKILSEQGLKEPVLFNKVVGNASYDTDRTQIE
ncbi:hypothetical protein G6F56_012394 [Rhizopus delemar]|nr:hypothetical protein G6F56_012394 [Rhizopus delemar]